MTFHLFRLNAIIAKNGCEVKICEVTGKAISAVEQATAIAHVEDAIERAQTRSREQIRLARALHPAKIELIAPPALGDLEPKDLIRQAVEGIRHPQLRAFMQAVCQEPEVNGLLCLRRKNFLQSARSSSMQLAIQYLHYAATQAAAHDVLGSGQREVVYAATLLQGCKTLLQPTRGTSADDLLFTIVRQGLHRLDDNAPHHARLLRLCLGWGNVDESGSEGIRQVQNLIRLCLSRVLKSSNQSKN